MPTIRPRSALPCAPRSRSSSVTQRTVGGPTPEPAETEPCHRGRQQLSRPGAPVRIERCNGVSTLTLDRPERLNALNAAATLELTAAVREAEADPATRAVLITGAGRAFCAGGDMDGMGLEPDMRRIGHRDIELHRALLDLSKPLVAYVNGAAVGFGFSLALACDVTVAAEDAIVGDPHTLLGLVAGDGAIVPLTLTLGPAKAKERLLTADVMTAKE